MRSFARHLIAILLAGMVLLSARWAVPPVVDAVTGAAPGGDVELVRPLGYAFVAPLSNILDALTFAREDLDENMRNHPRRGCRGRGLAGR